MGNDTNNRKPTTYQRDLAKLPRALAPLIERPQWCIWRWTQKPDGSWQKPPFQAMQPDAHASTKNPNTWSDYDAALDAVQTGRADGITYILTETDPFGAIDLDYCRNPSTHSIDVWAQNFMQAAVTSYQEVTPSGAGIRIWGFANGDSLHRKFSLEIDGKPISLELFRRTHKALTITGYKLDNIHELTNVDRALDWAVVWGERRKAVATAAVGQVAGNSFNGGGNGAGYSIEQIERFVREGAPAGENRSDLFHTIVGHYLGCGWEAEWIYAHLQQFPDGIGGRYLSEGRLSGEIARSAGKFKGAELPRSDVNGWTGNGWEAKAPQQPEPEREQEPQPELSEADPELDDEEESPLQPELGETDPELDDDDELDDPEQDPDLPPLYAHGDPDPRPLKPWLVG